MLTYKDFGMSKIVSSGTFIKTNVLAALSFDEVVMEVNAWMEEGRNEIQIISVETVQLTETPPFVRVWYTHNHGA